METDKNAHVKSTVELHTEYTKDNCDVMNAVNSCRPPGYIPQISSRDLCQTPNIPSAQPPLFSQPKPPAKLLPLSFTYAHKNPF